MSKLTPKQLEIACGYCSHFTGCSNDQCKAGVSYSSFKGSLPCIARLNKLQLTCDRRRPITPEEAQAEHDEYEAHSAMCNKALPIVAECKNLTRHGRGTAFQHECPACGQGTLRIRISPGNLHAAVRCSTPRCIAWIE